MRWKRIYWWFLLPVVVSLVSLSVGRFPISIYEVINTLGELLKGNFRNDEIGTILIELRMPRVVAALLIGSALSVSGVAYQAVFRNPLASPDILGVTAGAGFGGLVAMLLGFSTGGVWLYATGFGLLAMSLTTVIARNSKDRRVGFLLAGLIVTTLFSSLISLVKILADPNDQLPAMVFWLMGSLSYSDWKMVQWIAAPLVGGIIVVIMLRWRLNLLMLNSKEINGLGINLKFTFWSVILVVTMMTAVIVSAVGIIAWVGLVIPHLSRLLIGENNRQLVPISVLIGASYLVLMDTLARSVSTQEIPIGILTSVGGAIIFLVVWKFISKRNVKYD